DTRALLRLSTPLTGVTSSLVDASHAVGYSIDPNNLVITMRLVLTGDTNLDGTVNFADLLTTAQHYGNANAFWYEGDFNYDGKVDFADLLKVAQNYGKSNPPATLAASFTVLQPPTSEVLRPRKARRL